jgi:hypothetical protein
MRTASAAAARTIARVRRTASDALKALLDTPDLVNLAWKPAFAGKTGKMDHDVIRCE